LSPRYFVAAAAMSLSLLPADAAAAFSLHLPLPCHFSDDMMPRHCCRRCLMILLAARFDYDAFSLC